MSAVIAGAEITLVALECNVELNSLVFSYARKQSVKEGPRDVAREGLPRGEGIWDSINSSDFFLSGDLDRPP